ncbi:MAG: hypothetical protein V4603_03100, partial [Pseudomonadota bacterium]
MKTQLSFARTNAVLKLLVVTGLAAVISACATDPAATELAANTVAAADTPKEEVICRKQKVTGSNFPKEVCRTARQWGVISGNQRAAADEYSRQSTQNGTR